MRRGMPGIRDRDTDRRDSERDDVREPVTVPWLEWELPSPLETGVYTLADQGRILREKVLGIAPGPLINNSSNLIGALHMAGEVMMLKANGTKMLDGVADPRGFDYVWLPFKNTIKNAGFTFSLSDVKRPGFLAESLKNLMRYEDAARLETLRTMKPLVNRWQARATLVGMAGMTLAALMPDDKDSREDVEEVSRLYQDHPAYYFGKRFYQAVNPLEWPAHKRQFAGLAIATAGVCSFLSGFRNVTALNQADAVAKNLKYIYRLNPSHAAGGFITMLGGMQLWSGLDDEQAWKKFGQTMLLRVPLLYGSIGNRFNTGNGVDPGRYWYVGGQATFTGKDMMAYLIGGAEKDEHGNLIDKEAIRRESMQKAKAEQKEAIQLRKPDTQLQSHPRDVQPLQPSQEVQPAR